MFDIPLSNQSQYEGEYLGGHIQHQSGIRILMKFENSKIDIFQYNPEKNHSSELVSNRPCISILYDKFVGAQVIGQEKLNTLHLLVYGSLVALLTKKNELFLQLIFKDDIGLEQNLI